MIPLGAVGIFHVTLIKSIPTPLSRRSDTTPGSKMTIKLINKYYDTLPASSVFCDTSLLIGPVPPSLYAVTVTV